MSISYPLDLPTFSGKSRITIYANSAISISRSQFSYSSFVQDWGGQQWGAEVTFVQMTRANADLLTAFLLKLNGPLGTFRLGDSLAVAPKGLGYAGGTPVVSGDNQTGNVLNVAGWTPNASNVLVAGDYIQIVDRLYTVLNTISADGSGNTALDIWPKLRESPTSGTALNLTSPKGKFRLSANKNAIYSVDASQTYSLSFTAIEAV